MTAVNSAQASDISYERGAVKLTIGGTTRRVKASRSKTTDDITAFGVALRYATGSKLWHGSISEGSFANGTEYSRAQGGMDSRAMHRRLSRLTIVGFTDDIPAERCSKR